MNSPSFTAQEFGPVLIAGLVTSASGSTVAVKLTQQVVTTYPPGARAHFLLQDSLAPPTSKRIITHRKTTQRLAPDEAALLNVGQPMGGHIARTLCAEPRYAAQKPAYEGGYASSAWHPDYVADADERLLPA